MKKTGKILHTLWTFLPLPIFPIIRRLRSPFNSEEMFSVNWDSVVTEPARIIYFAYQLINSIIIIIIIIIRFPGTDWTWFG